MAAVSIVINNGQKMPAETGQTAGSSGRLVEFSINLPLFPSRSGEEPRSAVPQSPAHSAR